MSDPRIQLGALLLSAIMQTPNDRLAALRKQRIGRGSDLELVHLLRVREILVELHRAIEADESAGWDRIHDAWKTLHGSEQDDPRQVADDGEVSIPEPPEPLAEDVAVAERATSAGEPAQAGDAPPAPPMPAVGEAPPAPPAPIVECQPSVWQGISMAAAEPAPRQQSPAAAASVTSHGEPPGVTLPFSGQAAPPTASAEHARVPSGTLGAMPIERVTLPFANPDGSPTGAAAKSLVGYAAYCAICDAVPSVIAIVGRVYGVKSGGGREALRNAWREWFAADPASHELFQAVQRQFRGWLLRHPPG